MSKSFEENENSHPYLLDHYYEEMVEKITDALIEFKKSVYIEFKYSDISHKAFQAWTSPIYSQIARIIYREDLWVTSEDQGCTIDREGVK